MKILWVNAGFLHPLDRGGTIRSYHMLRELKEQNEITYLTLEAEGDDGEKRRQAGEYCDRLVTVDWPGAPPRSDWRFYVQALANLRSDLPLALERYASPSLVEELGSLTRSEPFDLVVSDFLFPAVNFQAVPEDVSTVLFQHNVESMIWERLADSSRLLGPYYDVQARRMNRWEGELARRFDGVVTVSEEDARVMRDRFGLERVGAVPTGVDVDYFHPRPHPEEPGRIVFVGSLDWLPNMDAVSWLLEDVWPHVRAARPELILDVVGRRPARRVRRAVENAPGAELWPDVPDVRDYLWRADLVVVPLRAGGGTRLKIFEALACGKAVVSTTIGAEGLPVEQDRHLIVEDEPQRFAEAILHLLDDPSTRERLEENGRRFVEENYSWERVAREFTERCRTLCAASAGKGRGR